MIAPGDITPRSDSDHDLYVVVLSNTIHLAAATGRVIGCPFVPGEIPGCTMAMVVTVQQPEGIVLPELVQWLPIAALAEPIGNIGRAALSETAGADFLKRVEQAKSSITRPRAPVSMRTVPQIQRKPHISRPDIRRRWLTPTELPLAVPVAHRQRIRRDSWTRSPRSRRRTELRKAASRLHLQR